MSEKRLSYLTLEKGKPVKLEVIGGSESEVENLKRSVGLAVGKKDRDVVLDEIFPYIRERFKKDKNFRRKLLKGMTYTVIEDLIYV